MCNNGFFKGVIIKGLQGPFEFKSKGFPQHKLSRIGAYFLLPKLVINFENLEIALHSQTHRNWAWEGGGAFKFLYRNTYYSN